MKKLCKHAITFSIIKFRINYKVLLLTYKALNGLAPVYLLDTSITLLQSNSIWLISLHKETFTCCSTIYTQELIKRLTTCKIKTFTLTQGWTICQQL